MSSLGGFFIPFFLFTHLMEMKISFTSPPPLKLLTKMKLYSNIFFIEFSYFFCFCVSIFFRCYFYCCSLSSYAIFFFFFVICIIFLFFFLFQFHVCILCLFLMFFRRSTCYLLSCLLLFFSVLFFQRKMAKY